MSASASKLCPANKCVYRLQITDQLRSLVEGDEPCLQKAFEQVSACSDCGSRLSNEKDLITKFLSLYGLPMPHAGIGVLMSPSVRIRASNGGWEYKCGADAKSSTWIAECKATSPRCRGVSTANPGELFIELSKNPEKAFEMLSLCPQGHPMTCGDLEITILRKEFLMNLHTKCKYVQCPKKSGVCLHWHDKKERVRFVEKLDAYTRRVIRKSEGVAEATAVRSLWAQVASTKTKVAPEPRKILSNPDRPLDPKMNLRKLATTFIETMTAKFAMATKEYENLVQEIATLQLTIDEKRHRLKELSEEKADVSNYIYQQQSLLAAKMSPGTPPPAMPSVLEEASGSPELKPSNPVVEPTPLVGSS